MGTEGELQLVGMEEAQLSLEGMEEQVNQERMEAQPTERLEVQLTPGI